MDPDICFVEMIEAAIEGRPGDCADRISALCEWIKRGGFAPNDHRIISLVDWPQEP